MNRYALPTSTVLLPGLREFKLVVNFGADLAPSVVDFQVSRPNPAVVTDAARDEALSLLARIETRRGRQYYTATLFEQIPGVVRLEQVRGTRFDRSSVTRRKQDLPLFCLYDSNLRRLVENEAGLPLVGDSPEELVEKANEPRERHGESLLALDEKKRFATGFDAIPGTGGHGSRAAFSFEIRTFSRFEAERLLAERIRQEDAERSRF